MKLSIVTFFKGHSFGASLQAFSLYSYLKNKNNEVFLQDYDIKANKQPLIFKQIIVNFFNIYFKLINKNKIIQSQLKFDKFVNKLQLTDKNNLPLYICGSDQIWHPGNLNKYFTLEFTNDNSKRASYAVSIGVSKINPNYYEIYKNFIEKIPYLSFREENAANEIKRITGRESRIDIDPTFLNTKEFWKKQEKEYKVRNPYIILYFIYNPPKIKKLINKIKKENKDKDILLIDNTGLASLRYGVKSIIDIGPREFLYLIDHAEKIYTSSFHGCAFSIIFEKQFKAFANPTSPTRIDNLLNITGITNMDSYIDYEIVNKNLEPYIENSKKYLNTLTRDNNE